MKKIILATLLLITLQSTAQRRNVQVEFGQVGFGLLAGGAFVAAGLLQKPDERWDSNKGNFQNPNAWRKETFFEDRERVAAVASGLFIFTLAVTIKF